jgi:plasmid stability protein
MNAMTIRKIDDELKHNLMLRAKSNKRSMEEEARSILRAALVPLPATTTLADLVESIFGPEDRIDDFPTIERTPARIIEFES